MAAITSSLQAEELKWLQGRLVLLESMLCAICQAPTAPSAATLQVIFHHLLSADQALVLWMPLMPARFRRTQSLWAPALECLLYVLLHGQVEQQAQVLPHLAHAVAAALHAKQIPVQDLLGILSFAAPTELCPTSAARPAYTQAFARLVLESFIEADGCERQTDGSTADAIVQDGSMVMRQQVIKAFMGKARKHILAMMETWTAQAASPTYYSDDSQSKSPETVATPEGLPDHPIAWEYATEICAAYPMDRLEYGLAEDTATIKQAAQHDPRDTMQRVVMDFMHYFDLCGKLASSPVPDEHQLQLCLQEIYEGCLTKLEGHGLVQLVLGSTAGLLDADLVCESDLCKLLHLTAAALEHLLCECVVRYSGVLAAVEQDAALARHGLTQEVLSAMLGIGLQPLLLARHSEGPLGLQSLDLEATARCAWLTYFKNCACSSIPVTQAGQEMARHLKARATAEAVASSKPKPNARAAAALQKLAMRQAAAEQASTVAAAQAAVADAFFEEATVDAALNASELVMEEQQAAELADQARQRNAAKKLRQKQRKQAQRVAALQDES